MDEIVKGVPNTKKLLIGGDLNGNIRSSPRVYNNVHGVFGFYGKNIWGASLFDFFWSYGLMVANSRFPKKKVHLVNFQSLMARTQIDFLFHR